MVVDISERSLQGLSAREGLSYRGHSERGANKKIAFGDLDEDCADDETNIKEVPMKRGGSPYQQSSSSSKSSNKMGVFGMVLAFAAVAGVAYTAGSTTHSSDVNNDIADAFKLPRELLQRDEAPILAPSQEERDLGLFDSATTTESCNSIFAYKKAFTYDIFTCEKALVVQAVTSVKKDSPNACEHDTGREMELLTGLTDPFDYTNRLVEICEETKRALENSVGCSRYPTGGWHDGRVIREYSPTAINPDTQQTYAANGEYFEWYECAKLCVDNADCEFWTLRLSWNKHCLIRKNKGKYNEHDQHIEGSRDEDCATPGDGHARYTSEEPTIDTLFPLTDHGCTGRDLIKKMDDECFCDSVASLIAKYPSTFQSYDDVSDALETACSASWETLQVAQWADVSPELEDDITDVHTGEVLGDRIWEYTIGGGQMNYDVGQLQGPQSTNENQITDDRTRRIAADVGEYFMDGHIQDAPLAPVQDMESCEIPAIMCCFGRDRQFGDNNGNCQDGNCVNKSPGDNTNVCFDEDHNEGSVHCHGLVWSEDSENDVSYRLRYNNLFFVSLFDHWYQRGYVENFMDSSGHFTQYPMCGCMEKMPAVTRSDCTEAHVEFEFTVAFDDQTGTFTATHEDQQRMGVRFNACRGPRYTEPGEPSKGTKTNDLSSQINKLFYEGKLSNETRFDIFLNHLVGYENPDANHNEPACDAYMEREGYGAN